MFQCEDFANLNITCKYSEYYSLLLQVVYELRVVYVCLTGMSSVVGSLSPPAVAVTNCAFLNAPGAVS